MPARHSRAGAAAAARARGTFIGRCVFASLSDSETYVSLLGNSRKNIEGHHRVYSFQGRHFQKGC